MQNPWKWINCWRMSQRYSLARKIHTDCINQLRSSRDLRQVAPLLFRAVMVPSLICFFEFREIAFLKKIKKLLQQLFAKSHKIPVNEFQYIKSLKKQRPSPSQIYKCVCTRASCEVQTMTDKFSYATDSAEQKNTAPQIMRAKEPSFPISRCWLWTSFRGKHCISSELEWIDAWCVKEKTRKKPLKLQNASNFSH